MKKYRLKKDLPTFRAGDEFELRDNGNLYLIDPWKNKNHWATQVCAYCKTTLDKFPDILKNWFEEIPEEPKTVYDLSNSDECWTVFCTESGYVPVSIRFNKLAKMFRETGSLYLTKEEAEKDIAWNKAKETLIRDAKGFKPDWDKASQNKFYVLYNYLSDDFSIYAHHEERGGQIYFATQEDAEASIKAHAKEWKIYLGVED